jgi:hypothetical protein
MARRHYIYWVQRSVYYPAWGHRRWEDIPGTYGNKSFTTGVLFGLTMIFPCPAVRVMRRVVADRPPWPPAELVKHHPGNSKPAPGGTS